VYEVKFDLDRLELGVIQNLATVVEEDAFSVEGLVYVVDFLSSLMWNPETRGYLNREVAHRHLMHAPIEELRDLFQEVFNQLESLVNMQNLFRGMDVRM